MKLKKPKFWDINKPNFFSNLLLPFAKIVELKSKFSFKTKKKFKNIRTICVGNIYIGGTGKTSLSIEIKKILDKENIKSCFIKKDYSDHVDEQKLLKKFGKTFINKSRILALQEAISEKYAIAIFDDGLQDKDIDYDLIFVCFNKKNMIGNGLVIPAGPLRESFNNIKRYKNIFLNGNNENSDYHKDLLRKQSQNLDIFESEYEISNLKSLNIKEKYIVFSGIGNHRTFVETLIKNKIDVIQNIEYPDHYKYSKSDLEKIIKSSNEKNASILTTEKDFLRIDNEYQKKIKYVKIFLKISEINKLKNKLLNFYENN